MGTLVVGRKIGERILLEIDDVHIDLLVFDAGEGKADIAIKAPPCVKIHKKKRHIEELLNGFEPRGKDR